jgi:hypothetical protein
MDRDMDLVRELLLQITASELRPTEWSNKEVYHLKMLSDVGFIEGIQYKHLLDGWVAAPSHPQLTWRGHEFLDTIREKSVWDKVKNVAKEKGVGLTIETITKIASAVVTALLTAPKS